MCQTLYSVDEHSETHDFGEVYDLYNTYSLFCLNLIVLAINLKSSDTLKNQMKKVKHEQTC